jgi:hypothetical protein
VTIGVEPPLPPLFGLLELKGAFAFGRLAFQPCPPFLDLRRR